MDLKYLTITFFDISSNGQCIQTGVLHFPILQYSIAQIKFMARRSEVSNTSDEEGLSMCSINYRALFLNL